MILLKRHIWSTFRIGTAIYLLLITPTALMGATTVTFEQLKGLNNETGYIPDEIKKLDQQTVEVAGFIVPLELDEFVDEVTEFLLVPDPLACIHVPPPSPNQMVYVEMNKPIPVDMDFRGVAITGTLTIPTPKAEYGDVSYKVKGVSAKEANIEYIDPLFELIESEMDENWN